ncbi:hypothetical protein D3C73_1145590 [compost metagenome]
MYLACGECGLDDCTATRNHLGHAVIDLYVRIELVGIEDYPVDPIGLQVGDQRITTVIGPGARGVDHPNAGDVRHMGQATGFTHIGAELKAVAVEQQRTAGVERNIVVSAALSDTRAQAGNGCLVGQRQFSGFLLAFIVGQGRSIVESISLAPARQRRALIELAMVLPQVEGGGGRAAEVQRHRDTQADLAVVGLFFVK